MHGKDQGALEVSFFFNSMLDGCLSFFCVFVVFSYSCSFGSSFGI